MLFLPGHWIKRNQTKFNDMQLKKSFLLIAGTLLFLGNAMLQPASAQQASVKLFAHRGGAHEFDENTLEAFRSSYEKGIRGFETDIRISKDGELVIFHDASLKRMVEAEGGIETLTSKELRKFKTKKGNPILFLDEFLDYFKDKPGVYIEFEMKTNSPMYDEAALKTYCDKLYQKEMAARPQGSDYVFTSFDKRPLKYLKKTYPGVDLLFIKSEGLSDSLIAELEELGITRIGCRLDGTTRAMVEKAQKKGITVSCWPGRTVEDFVLGVGLGCDYLCSDIPVQVRSWAENNLPWVIIK